MYSIRWLPAHQDRFSRSSRTSQHIRKPCLHLSYCICSPTFSFFCCYFATSSKQLALYLPIPPQYAGNPKTWWGFCNQLQSFLKYWPIISPQTKLRLLILCLCCLSNHCTSPLLSGNLLRYTCLNVLYFCLPSNTFLKTFLPPSLCSDLGISCRKVHTLLQKFWVKKHSPFRLCSLVLVLRQIHLVGPHLQLVALLYPDKP